MALKTNDIFKINQLYSRRDQETYLKCSLPDNHILKQMQGIHTYVYK